MPKHDGTREDPLTLEDLAVLADEDDAPIQTTRRLGKFARAHPPFARRIGRLRAMARDAGVERLKDGLLLNLELDQLISAKGWQHPAEVLDPQGNIGISYQELVRIAEARAKRGENPAVLLPIKNKLAQAWAAQQAEEAPVQSIVARLLAHDPGDAEKLLNQAFAEYRLERRKQDGDR